MALNTGIAQDDFETHARCSSRAFTRPGVGARDLRECLLIQLKRDGQGEQPRIQDRPATTCRISASAAFPEIARRMGITVEQVQKCANNIAQLDPRPGQIFAAAPQNYVLPDVTVEKIDGEYQIILNGEQIPHLRISNTYKDIMSQDGNGSEVKDYIRDKIRSGKFLIKSIHQRQQTISNIAHQIVSRQKEFLDHGTGALEADDHGADRRHRRRARDDGEPRHLRQIHVHAAGRLRDEVFLHARLPDLERRIDEQHQREGSDPGPGERRRPAASPLSDKEIVEILSKRGIPIARRTVAKYRTELNILPSNMRRKY